MYDIDFIEQIPSTNAYAKENLDKLPHLKIISADLQTKGHGQFERVWYSSNKNGGNIYISIVFKPKELKNLDKLTQFGSLKAGETLIEYGLKPTYKYPNDILIENRKICGILAESVFLGNTFKGAVLGIGINLNLDEDELKNIDIPATSIYFETKKRINKIEFLNRLLDNLIRESEDFFQRDIKGEILWN